eukprot:1106565-Prorocentrum_minimum.AAC.1
MPSRRQWRRGGVGTEWGRRWDGGKAEGRRKGDKWEAEGGRGKGGRRRGVGRAKGGGGKA